MQEIFLSIYRKSVGELIAPIAKAVKDNGIALEAVKKWVTSREVEKEGAPMYDAMMHALALPGCNDNHQDCRGFWTIYGKYQALRALFDQCDTETREQLKPDFQSAKLYLSLLAIYVDYHVFQELSAS